MGRILKYKSIQSITRDELNLITMPDSTESYILISHDHLVEKFLTISQDILRDYVLVGENYGITRRGNQLFVVLKFRGINPELGLSVAFRNSYDRSMAIGMAIGAIVFICDNLALSGEIAMVKKHTKNVLAELEDAIIATIYRGRSSYKQIEADAEVFKALPIDDNEAFRLMGVLYGNNILSPRQLTALKKRWLKPTYLEFRDRNMWSFYNAATDCLKTTPPISVMEKHIQLHKILQRIIS